MEKRVLNEILHGKKIADIAGKVWNWEGPAGKERWKRRSEMLTLNIVPGMRVLEIGCGVGYLTKVIADKGARITSIDVSFDLIRAAKSKVTSSKIIFLLQDACNLGLADNSFDAVIGSSVLHHLEVEKALKEFYRVLKPGGCMYFTEPNMMNPQIAIQKNINFIKKISGDSAYETAFFSWRLRKTLIRNGFRIVKLKTFDYLHPKTPSMFIPLVRNLGNFLESIPVVSEIAGSIYIEAKK